MTQGATPQGLALTLALGFVIGTIPLLGWTTLLCFLAGLLFSLNQPLIQILNYLFYPLQILLMPVFLSWGQTLYNEPQIEFDLQKLMQEFKADWMLFFIHYTKAGLHAVTVWALVSPLVGFFIYSGAYFVFQKLKTQRE